MKRKSIQVALLRQLDPSFKRLLFITFIIFSIMAFLRPSSFLTSRNMVSMAFQFPEMGILALAISIAFISGGMDLSLVGISNLSGILGGYLMLGLINEQTGTIGIFFAIAVSILASLCVGVLCGVLNGVLISRLNISPILATLGTMQLYTGIALILTKGSALIGFPQDFSFLGQGSVGLIPVPLIIFLITAFGLHHLLSRTYMGHSCYYIGTNQKAAKFAGIPIARTLLKTYMVSGMLAALAGIIMMSRVNSAKADFGSSYTMQSILVAVLGGVSPLGGKGKVAGVIIAVLALQFLSSGFGMLRMSQYAKEFVWGFLLVALVAMNILWDGRKSR
jgi:simple sugar transport system permease protein